MSGAKRGRLIAFRVVAAIGVVLHTAPIVFLAVSLASAKDRLHVVHNTAGLAVFTAVIALGWLLAAIAPGRMIAPFQAATVAFGCLVIAAALSAAPQAAAITAPFAIVLVVLHPDRALLWRFGRTAPLPLTLAAAAAVPAVLFAWSNTSLQRNGQPLDPHVQMDHWVGMAAFTLAAVGAAIVAGLGGGGRRIVAMAGGGAVALVGVVSLAYSKYPGALSTTWAVGSIVWGLILAGDGSRMERIVSGSDGGGGG